MPKKHAKVKMYFDDKGKLVKSKNHEDQPMQIPEGMALYRPGEKEGDPPMPCYYIGGTWVCIH